MANIIYILFLFFIITFKLQAQVDSLLLYQHKDTIILEQQRLPEFGLGSHTLLLDNNALQKYSARNLAQVLQLESSLFVKNYGPSGISSLSGRGGGASHTAVLWEGVNIQSPMLGQADISLLPASFVDNIAVQYGGASALFGNSSIGGAVHLSTQSSFDKGWQFKGNVHGGSFEDFGQELQLSFGNHWYAGSVRAFYHSAKNNYWFKDVNAFGNPKPIRAQNNANLEQFGLLHEHLFNVKAHQFGFKMWYQNSHRKIPPTLLQTTSNDQQDDCSLRSVATWKWLLNNQVWKARTALFWETLLFKNDGVNSLSKVLSSVSEVENKWYINQHHLLNIGLNYSYYKAFSDGYNQSPEQHRVSLFVAYKVTTKDQKLLGSLSLREEVVNGRFITPAASLGMVWLFYKKISLNANISHNYRLPTFNDLYWNVLGNSNLKPEYSWNNELGIEAPIQLGHYHLKTTLTGFCNLVNDWILWSPNQAGYWRPSNVEQVWAKGLEASISLKRSWKKWSINTGGNYAFTQSTRTKGQQLESIGKQLIYVPLHNANLQVEVQFDKTSLLYQHSFTAQRFIDNNNTEALPFFQVGHLRLSQQLVYKELHANIYVQLNNLFGTDYQVVSNRAMPWQQIEIGVSCWIGK